MTKIIDVSNIYVNNWSTMGGGIAPKYLSISYILKLTLKS